MLLKFWQRQAAYLVLLAAIGGDFDCNELLVAVAAFVYVRGTCCKLFGWMKVDDDPCHKYQQGRGSPPGVVGVHGQLHVRPKNKSDTEVLSVGKGVITCISRLATAVGFL